MTNKSAIELHGETLLDLLQEGLLDLEDDDLFRKLTKECLFFLHMDEIHLANHMSVSKSTIQRWINGNAIPHPAMRKPPYKFLKENIEKKLEDLTTFIESNNQVTKKEKVENLEKACQKMLDILKDRECGHSSWIEAVADAAKDLDKELEYFVK